MSHRIEQSVKVYLTLSADGTHWHVDDINRFGELDGLAAGADIVCGDSPGCDGEGCCEGCEAAKAAADEIGLPSLAELTNMLVGYYTAGTTE